MFKRYSRGFTLIELLVVIAIIGILSSVVLASLNDARQKSRDAKRIADIKQLQLALELYFDSNGSYPLDIYSTTAGLAPDFISVMPTDPVSDAEYDYAYNADPATEYHLGATLEQTGHTTLGADADADTTATGENFTGGFDGSDDANDGIYDVKP